MKNSINHKLAELMNKEIISFHVPGHKNGRIYDKLGYSEFVQSLYKMDTTEIFETDNLHSPEGIIKASQERASEVFKSEKSFYLVNGSTCGIEAAILSCCKPKSKILINRDCHQSAINACILGDINPVYISGQICKETNMIKGLNVEDVIYQIDNNEDINVIMLTYPSYYGTTFDLEKICEYAHSKDMIVIVDEAHGAHLNLNKNLPKTALEQGADIVIQSLHKTLPSFTQSSILHIQGDRVNEENLKRFLKILQSSSPSYMLMATLELAIDIYEKHGYKLMDNLKNNIDKFEEKLKEVKGMNMFKGEDFTKIFISSKNLSIKGYELEELLRYKYNIQVELSNYYGVLLICTIGNEKEDFDKMFLALQDIAKNYKEKEILKDIEYPVTIPKKHCSPREAFYSDKKVIDIEESIGHISGEYIIPYPPGISLISPGEEITKEVIDYVLFCKKYGMNVNGLKDEKLKTIEIIENIY